MGNRIIKSLRGAGKGSDPEKMMEPLNYTEKC